jgi:hypothetical protein
MFLSISPLAHMLIPEFLPLLEISLEVFWDLPQMSYCCGDIIHGPF